VSTGLASAHRCAKAVSAALCALVFWSASLQGQSLGTHLSARAGSAIPDDAYSSNCGDGSIVFSLDVEGRRQVFPQISVDYFAGPSGGDVSCTTDPAVGVMIGGLRVEGSTRVGLGVGARLGTGRVQLEGVVSSGFVSGRRGFVANAEDDSRHIMPHAGGRASLVLFRYMVFSAGINWTRLSFDLRPPSGGPVATKTSWAPLTTLQIGLRLPAKR
jgi:hypothetical protein